MIESAGVSQFTVFSDASLDFGKLNVLHGENGTGKTHLLKLLYSVCSATSAGPVTDARPTKARLQRDIAEKLVNVFKPDKLGRLVRRPHNRQHASVKLRFLEPAADLEFRISRSATTEVVLDSFPPVWWETPPVYLPPRELMSLQPEFLGLAQERYLPFEETWTDTSRLIAVPLSRGPRAREIAGPLEDLERAMGGAILSDRSGRFYLQAGGEPIEMHLVAEGLRKLATVARLLLNRGLKDKSALFWDEPEANLNPRLIKLVAPLLLSLAGGGMQVFVATHSLFLLREIHLMRREGGPAVRYFGLHPDVGGVKVQQGDKMEDSGDLAALDEDLSQSQRYIDAEFGVQS